MSKTRNNHYVPRWYQERFFEPGSNTLAYVDLTPAKKVLPDGRIIVERSTFKAPTARAFCQRDLYSTFFGTTVDDEIERRLFGKFDAEGSKAVRAFSTMDVGQWHEHFRAFFEYIDIQKIRTPKGLDWLAAQYPKLTQNQLMIEMQGIHMMRCTIWTEGVREIVSAEDADVKFIVSDHPVAIYNHAASPDSRLCQYPLDPDIALRGSQTIFPLSRDLCLILTNLEYAQNPATDPLRKRTFARNFRTSMVRTNTIIRERRLNNEEVSRINFVIKARARRYIAAGKEEWLYPERTVTEKWKALAPTLLPPPNKLFAFGGELYVKYNDGRVHYQDQFGRTEKERDFLRKAPPVKPPRLGDSCGCGSGRSFKVCCRPRPIGLRPSWSERSIRERNLMLFNGIANVLKFDGEKDWVRIRRELTDEQIKQIYLLYEGLWPVETNLLDLLPRPDGIARSVYTGPIHPTAIAEYALGSSLYFGELIVQHPFLNPATVKAEFRPTEHPKKFRHEFLKSVSFFLGVIPLVQQGLINLIPDPCDFDLHLRDQMMQMAKARASRNAYDPRKEPRIEKLASEDFKRSLLSLPPDVLKAQLGKGLPPLERQRFEDALEHIELVREGDPLAVLQDYTFDDNEKGGQFTMMKFAPNFEMALYIAQATGSAIVTDSQMRWGEIQQVVGRQRLLGKPHLQSLSDIIEGFVFRFPQHVADILAVARSPSAANYNGRMRDVFRYLSRIESTGPKPNVEQQLNARVERGHTSVQNAIKASGGAFKDAKVSCAFPYGGIQDNNVNRLLLMSSSERHLPSVPMAFFIEERASAS